MNQQTNVELAEPARNFETLSEPPRQAEAGNVPAAVQEEASFGQVITAQPIGKPRDVAKVMKRMEALASIAGDKYVYSWEVNDKRNRRKVQVKGPTVKLANDLAREYGNCVIDTRVFDFGTYWVIYARFVDLETGFSYTRPFQQDKGKNIGGGMKDDSRARDLIFQIGVSKAIRNCVVNALSTFVEPTIEAAEKRLIDWVKNNADKAAAYIERICGEHEIDFKRIEVVIGRPRGKWTVRDVTRVMSELRGIEDGLTRPEEVWPSDADVAELEAETEEEKPAAKPKAKAKPKATKAKEKAEEPPQEPEPEPEPEPEEEAPEEEPESDGEDDDLF